MIVVSNAGPLIALARVDQLALLPGLYGTVFIPRAVEQEVTGMGLKRRGILTAIAPVLEQLMAAGFRMNDDLMRTALKLSGESVGPLP